MSVMVLRKIIGRFRAYSTSPARNARPSIAHEFEDRISPVVTHFHRRSAIPT
jgi:hypothetical protein